MFLKTTYWLPGIEEIPTTRQNWQEDTGDGLSVNIALVTKFSPLPATISMLTACVSMVTAWLLILLLLAGLFLLMMTKKVYSRACALSQRSLSLMPLNFFFHGFFFLQYFPQLIRMNTKSPLLIISLFNFEMSLPILSNAEIKARGYVCT